ncbi:MAG: FMN-binding protein [Oligoflexia bacterium]|nr:FMN-binding protein [Oligoflexia bacterium]
MSARQLDPGTTEPEAGPLKLVATLTIAGLLSGVAIVGAWQTTRPTILAYQAQVLKAAVFKVVPGAQGLQRLAWQGQTLAAEADPGGEGDDTPVVYGAYDASGALIGYAIPAEGAGFQDKIGLIYGYDPDASKIVGLRVLDSRETPGLGDKIIKDQEFVHGWDDLSTTPSIELVAHGKKAAPNQVEAISGATISSKAVMRIVSGSYADWAERLPKRADAPRQEITPAASPAKEVAP